MKVKHLIRLIQILCNYIITIQIQQLIMVTLMLLLALQFQTLIKMLE